MAVKTVTPQVSGRVQDSFFIGYAPADNPEIAFAGVIEGGELSGPKADDSLKLQEVAPYWCAPAWYQSAGVNGVMVNKQAWESLPEAYQVAFESAARLCCGEQLSRYIYNDMTVTNQMIEDQGVTVTSLSDEDMQLIRETCIETYKEEGETGPATTASASTAANERLFNN